MILSFLRLLEQVDNGYIVQQNRVHTEMYESTRDLGIFKNKGKVNK